MSKYRIKMDLPIDADSPEEAAEKFRQWLRMTDWLELFSPCVDVVEQGPDASPIDYGDPIPMDIAVFDWWDREQKSHMQPCVDWMDEAEFETEDFDGGPPIPCEAGFYSRLSAPGFMDCTEWDGPHETKYLAMEALYNVFGE